LSKLLKVEFFKVLYFFGHSLDVDCHFGKLFLASAEGRSQEGAGFKGGFGLGLLIGNRSGSKKVFD
jgi:hypothetical protein